MSEHPLYQKMGDIRTLFDRMNSVVTEEEDRLIEEDRVQAVSRTCGFLGWAMNKVKHRLAKKSQTKHKKRKQEPSETKRKGIVVIPYVDGIAERIQGYTKIKCCNSLETIVHPPNLLVHPRTREINSSQL